ncbi:MAG: putative zinc-binding metallopeptidase [Paludibacteraceae bacterium]|nr:putative zinc-binding metallopeptidase [Paludibacteraceae bacterium]
MKYVQTISIFILAAAMGLMTSCKKEEIDTESIFRDKPWPDSTLVTYAFDTWLDAKYIQPYNIDFRYRLQDESTDMEYNLVPAGYEQAQITAHCVKYLWLDVYQKQVPNQDFLKMYAPRIINILGCPAINAAQSTETLGVAEGGYKITLYNMNKMNRWLPQDGGKVNVAMMNKYIFHVMHHEFSHILHQAKSFPKEYETISAGDYDSQNWQYMEDTAAYHMGFVTPYSRSEAHEDFVEVISSYITDSIGQWQERGFYFDEGNTHLVSFNENQPGTKIINQKIDMAKKWLDEKYGITLDSIRAEVQRRQAAMTYDIVMNN